MIQKRIKDFKIRVLIEAEKFNSKLKMHVCQQRMRRIRMLCD